MTYPHIYVFSYNRGRFLDNCLQSVAQCAPGWPMTVIDDRSRDPSTRSVLERVGQTTHVVHAGEAGLQEAKTGGLYNNMNYALSDAASQGYRYALFIQDDMQLVRKLTDEDVQAFGAYFDANPRSHQLQTCFMKAMFASRDDADTVVDESRTAYIRSSKPQGFGTFAAFSAVGLFSVERCIESFGAFLPGEHRNNDRAVALSLYMGLSAYPFMMWLPYPESHRGRRRSIPLQLVETLGGGGYHPYELMTDAAVRSLRDRAVTERPYAEHWLRCPTVADRPTWSFAGGLSNLRARGGWRRALADMLSRVRHA